jgi:ribosomal protein L21E
MDRPSEGDRVRIDIPDETDPDHALYHGEHGTVVAI